MPTVFSTSEQMKINSIIFIYASANRWINQQHYYLSFIIYLLNNYHRFITISLTPIQQIINTAFNMNLHTNTGHNTVTDEHTHTGHNISMICLGSPQGGSRKQPRPSTVTTLSNHFSTTESYS